MVVGRAYGMIDEGATNSGGVRATYFIDPEGIIRAITHFPSGTRWTRYCAWWQHCRRPTRAQDRPPRIGGKSGPSSWAAFILTRPLGATMGDFLDKPTSQGGLALSRPLASAAIAIFIILCITMLPQRAGRHPSVAEA
jgi:hypothetical protein